MDEKPWLQGLNLKEFDRLLAWLDVAEPISLRAFNDGGSSIYKPLSQQEEEARPLFNMAVYYEQWRCKTMCCMAGFVAGQSYDCFNKATLKLGIMRYQANQLFFPQGNNLTNVNPKDAARVVRAFLETGEIDWAI